MLNPVPYMGGSERGALGVRHQYEVLGMQRINGGRGSSRGKFARRRDEELLYLR